MKSWKTTVTGLLAIAAAAWNIYQTGTITEGDVAALSAGLGLILAKDGKVTGGTIKQ